MSFCILRSMSPVHVEYLKNMGVTASMSVSITKGERLWGLISCHHMSPRIVRHPVRISCELLAQVFSAHIAAAEAEDVRGEAAAGHRFVKDLELRFRSRKQDVFSELSGEAQRLSSILGAQGAAICLGNEIALGGMTPPREAVADIVKWLEGKRDDYLYQTDKLQEDYPPAQEFAETATGLLAMRVALGSNDCVLWFRPPAMRVIEWGGNPDKPVEETEAGRRISPRLSFERWKQTFGDRSEAWRRHEQDFALSLRQVMAELLLIEKNEESAHLNMELGRSNIELDAFAYAVSHDLQEPVRTIRAYAQLLSRRNGKHLDDGGRELLNTIESGAVRMSNLITALLAYGQVGGSVKRESIPVNLGDVLRWVFLNLDESIRSSSAEITYDELPTVTGDPEQLTRLFQNLVGNAIKYRRPSQTPRIRVWASRAGTNWRINVQDNGQGFDEADADFIFGAFKRLHGQEVPGTGIGLALCRRIVENHGGRIWAESKGKGQGASFCFTLPQS
jgi:two-component system, chemotaxis family, sensor kinase Cph1